MFAPSLLPGLALVYLFGTQGFFKALLGGGSIYGFDGIVIAQVFYCFPHATLILIHRAALRPMPGSTRRPTCWARPGCRIFFTVTLPGAKYGLISAALVVFTLVITDFGIAKVIGGNFNVLATDVYKQVIGQQNFSMGAVVGMVLLAPAALAFVGRPAGAAQAGRRCSPRAPCRWCRGPSPARPLLHGSSACSSPSASWASSAWRYGAR